MQTAAAIFIILLITSSTLAAIKTETVEYQVGNTRCKGFLAFDDSTSGKRPGVIIVHEWWGLNDYPKMCAEQLAKLGYVAFAADMYGEGKTTRDAKEAEATMKAVVSDPILLKARLIAAMDTFRKQPQIDPKRIGAIGYCFGGGCVLNMARMGMDLRGVVSFHGSLGTTSPAKKGEIKAHVLVCHGANDNFLTSEDIAAFQKEMIDAGANWQMNIYSGAVHAFTNPNADKAGIPGVAYNKLADKRSWQAMEDFFEEVFEEED